MMIPLGTHQEGRLPSNQGGTGASRDLPLLLSLIDQREDEQQGQDHIADLAGAVTRLVEQRLPVTGETVSLTEMTLPHVHVNGLSARSAFGGYISAQAQLSPLMEAFPGWNRIWARLAAGDVKIVLLRTSGWTEPPLRAFFFIQATWYGHIKGQAHEPKPSD